MFSRLSRVGMVACVWTLTAGPAAADEWNERTTLTFSAPVMVPGATLSPGTYVFELVDPMSTQHIVRIRREGGDQVAIVQAVPLKRRDAKGDIALRFDPTDSGTPPALKGYFYPGSIYGHEFIYSSEEAQKIADRTKTVVLATDTPGTDKSQGTLRVYDASGTRNWQGDAATLKEWESWRQQRQTNANSRDQRDQQASAARRSSTDTTPGTPKMAEGVSRPIQTPGTAEARREASHDQHGQANPQHAESQPRDRAQADRQQADRQQVDREPADRRPADRRQADRRQDDRRQDDAAQQRASSTPMVDTTGQARRVDLDDLEDNPASFIGQTVSVDAEVEEIYGPRLFTIDEPNWADLGGEVLVYVPSALAALVDEDDRVTVTGTIERRPVTTLESEWGWLGFDPDISIETSDEPVLVASQIVGGDNDMVLLIDAAQGQGQVAGARRDEPAITTIADLSDADESMVGRRVTLDNVSLQSLASHDGFYVKSGEESVFVLPAKKGLDVTAGATVSVEGVVLKAPSNMRLTGDMPEDANDDIYVLATSIGQR